MSLPALSLHQFERQRQDFVRTLRAVQTVRTLANALAFEGQFKPATETVEPGLYHCMRITEAVDRYLYIAGVPQTVEQIVEGLKRGHVKTRSADLYKSVANALYRGQDTGRFRKFGTGRYWTIARQRTMPKAVRK